MPIVQLVQHGVELEFPDSISDEQIKSIIDKKYPRLENGQQSRENVYDNDRGAVINAPIGASVDQIRYEDDITNLGKSKADYFGYKSSPVPKEKDFYDTAMEFLSIPTEQVALQTAQVATAAVRAARDIGLTDEQASSVLLRKMEIGNERLNQSLAEKNKQFETSFGQKLAKDVFVGVSQIPYYAAVRTGRGAAALWGFLTTSKFEEIYQESQQQEAPEALISAALTSTVDVVGERLFFDILDDVAKPAVKKIVTAATVSSAEEAAATLTEDVSTIAFGIREKKIQDVVTDALYSGLVGAFVGTTAGGVSAAANAKANAKLVEELAGAGVENPEEIAKTIVNEAAAGAIKLEETIKHDVDNVNNDPKQVDEFYGAVQDIVEGNTEKIAVQMENVGIPKAEISRVVSNIQTIKQEAEQIKAVNKEMEATQEKVAKLDSDVKIVDRQIKELQGVIKERESEGKVNTTNIKRLEALMMQRQEIDAQRNELSAEITSLLPKIRTKDANSISLLDQGRRDTYEVAIKTPSVQNKLYDKFSQRMESLRTGAENVMTPIDSRLIRISPSIGYQLRGFQARHNVNVANRANKVEPLIRKMNKLPKKDARLLDIAMKNRWQDDIDVLAKKYKFEKELKEFRNVMDELIVDARNIGIDLGYLKNYYPRLINNPAKFLAALRKNDNWTMFDEALRAVEEKRGSILTEQEKSEVIRRMLMGLPVHGITLRIPSNAKMRNIEEIDSELMEFYSPTQDAIITYITDVTEAIEIRRFFGNHAKNKEMLPDELENVISTYILNELAKGNIKQGQDNEIFEIFKARFNQEKMNPLVRLYKNSQYILTMGNLKSAITQIGDVYTSLYFNGFYNTGLGIADIVSGKTPVTIKDLNINTIAAEFNNDSISGKAVDLVFTANFLKAADSFGKTTFLNSSMQKISAQAKAGNKALEKKIQYIFSDKTKFSDEANQLMEDLANGRITDNVKMLMATELMRVQPITLSQMPLKYLQNPNGRVFYILKTFMVKHLDMVRTEVFDQYKDDPVQAGQNLVRLAILFAAMGATADEIKNLLKGKVEDLSDIFVNNLFKFAGVSKFEIDRAKRQTIGETIKDTIFPPTRSPKDWRDVPVVGEIYYYWFGAGADDEDDKKKQKLTNSGSSGKSMVDVVRK